MMPLNWPQQPPRRHRQASGNEICGTGEDTHLLYFGTFVVNRDFILWVLLLFLMLDKDYEIKKIC